MDSCWWLACPGLTSRSYVMVLQLFNEVLVQLEREVTAGEVLVRQLTAHNTPPALTARQEIGCLPLAELDGSWL